jgi:hypothetical protein
VRPRGSHLFDAYLDLQPGGETRRLSMGRGYLEQAPWLGAFPGIAIFLAVLGFNLLGDGIRDALDPRLKTGSAARPARR